jgi:SAM-dependent methyltransferase
MRYVNGLFPFVYPLLHVFQNFNYFRGLRAYYADMTTYNSLQRKDPTPFPIKLINSYPIYFDRYEEAGEVPKHYFYMDLWAAKKIYQSSVKKHYDIGSRLDSFISHCLVFCKVTMLDVRPLASEVPGLEFIQADCMNMDNIRTGSIQSISTLHAIEHFGLGRYADPIDPLGYKKAINEIKRVTKKGGDIYFATPIGKQRIEFNAHRVFSPLYILELFEGCDLLEFSAVNDKNQFIENTDPKKYVKANYSCGMYHFRKK